MSEGRWGDFGVELSSLSDSDIFCSGGGCLCILILLACSARWTRAGAYVA